MTSWVNSIETHLKENTISCTTPTFSHVFDIANQLLSRHSPSAPLGQVDEQTAKPSRFATQGSLSELSRIMAAKTLNLFFSSEKLDVTG